MQCKKPSSILLPCPMCGTEGASISVNLWALDDTGAFICHDCEGEFSIDFVKDMIAKWTKMLEWVSQAPTISE